MATKIIELFAADFRGTEITFMRIGRCFAWLSANHQKGDWITITDNEVPEAHVIEAFEVLADQASRYMFPEGDVQREAALAYRKRVLGHFEENL